MDKASISLAGIFENGQAYVALSRVRSLQSMELKGVSRKAIRADKKVGKFYRLTFPENEEYAPFDEVDENAEEVEAGYDYDGNSIKGPPHFLESVFTIASNYIQRKFLTRQFDTPSLHSFQFQYTLSDLIRLALPAFS